MFWTVTHRAVQLGGRGAGPTALQKSFLPTKQGRWPTRLLPGEATSISGGRACAACSQEARGAGAAQSQHGGVGEWMSWGMGGPKVERSKRLWPRPLPCPHTSTTQVQPSQHRREAVSIQDFHATTHMVSSEVHQIYGSND